MSPSISGEARSAAASPAARANRPAADRLAAALDRDRPRLGLAEGGRLERRARLRQRGGDRGIHLAARPAGPARRSRSVVNCLPSQYQRWSALWPLIITAARSLPETATLRLRGPARSSSDRPASAPADARATPCNGSTRCPGRARPRRNRRVLSSRAIDWSIQLLPMIPVRAGWSPVRIVEWPGQVSVSAWL